MWREAGAGRPMRMTCTYFQFGLLCLDWIAVGLLGNTDTGFVGFLLFATCLEFCQRSSIEIYVCESRVGRTRSFFEMGISGIGFGQGVGSRSSVGCFSILMYWRPEESRSERLGNADVLCLTRAEPEGRFLPLTHLGLDHGHHDLL